MKVPDGKIRVAHLVSHPIQYFVPLYRALSERPEIDLTVYFFSVASLDKHPEPGFGQAVNWDVPLTGGYRHVICGDAATRPLSNRPDWKPNLGILRDLIRQRYDVIWLHGYMSGNAWLAVAIGNLLGTPVLLREEQTLLTPRSAWGLKAHQLILPRLFRHVSALYIGKSNFDFFARYGVRRAFRASYGVDNDFFRQRRDQLAPLRADIRHRFGIGDSHPVILFSGKFIDKKQPLLLLKAFRLVRRKLNCHLLMVGGGPLLGALEREIDRHAIPDVHFTGFLNQTEMPLAYTAADALVLPSAYQETWGLVVNEAMNFGLPIVVSDRVGCAADLVRAGENGFVFSSGDANGLANALQMLILSKELRSRYGSNSAKIIANYGVDAVCDQIVQACLTATGKTPLFLNCPPSMLSGTLESERESQLTEREP